MIEKDIQDYIFENPSYLFPNETVQEKAKEYSIKGKRIDLLFRVNGIRYIVEIKNVALEREHIGQIVEYYGLMKTYLNEALLRMILVAPRIESWQKTFLEELGIKCFEFKENLQGYDRQTSFKISDPDIYRNSNVKYWMVSVEYWPSLTELAEKKYDYLKDQFQNVNSKLNNVCFPKQHHTKFVKVAKEGDFIILTLHKDGIYNVYPPRQIINIDQVGSNNYYYMETTPDQRKQIIDFNLFIDRLSELNCDLVIKRNTNRLIPARFVECFRGVWENFKELDRK